jgi:hypothetical protein
MFANGKTAKRPKLTKDRAAKRPAWAIAHADWTEEDFRSVLCRDECSVEKARIVTQIKSFEHRMKCGI